MKLPEQSEIERQIITTCRMAGWVVKLREQKVVPLVLIGLATGGDLTGTPICWAGEMTREELAAVLRGIANQCEAEARRR